MSTKRYEEFKNRWLVEGTLTTLGPLHIGTGDWIEPKGGWDVPKDNWLRIDKPSEKAKFAKVSGLMRDHAGRPYIPGSTLKGCVRSWLESKFSEKDAVVRRSFGYQDAGTKGDGRGGRWEFLDARMPDGKTVATQITAQTAIDRVTRTADDRKLFHCEVTPAGTEFLVRIAGQNLEDEEVALLVEAMEGFNDESGAIAVGAGSADGWGRMKWVRTGLRKLTPDKLEEHLAAGRLAYEGLPVFEGTLPAAGVQKSAGAKIRIKVELRFDGAFLVNDPKRCKTKHDKKESDLPNHAPLRDERNEVYLPAASFRGAFRSQAERIFRTLGFQGLMNPSGRAALSMPEVRALRDPVSRLFGASGWRSPISISDFKLAKNDTRIVKRQEFVAIDRFTGGGAEHLKFNAEYVLRPVFHGTIEIDLDALMRAGVGGWGLGLLAFTLRDLREGDITFGFGAAKGYGACRGRITEVKTLGLANWPEQFRLPNKQAVEALFGGSGALTPEAAEWLTKLPVQEVA